LEASSKTQWPKRERIGQLAEPPILRRDLVNRTSAQARPMLDATWRSRPAADPLDEATIEASLPIVG
jgi:hypothetical protein